MSLQTEIIESVHTILFVQGKAETRQTSKLLIWKCYLVHVSIIEIYMLFELWTLIFNSGWNSCCDKKSRWELGGRKNIWSNRHFPHLVCRGMLHLKTLKECCVWFSNVVRKLSEQNMSLSFFRWMMLPNG